MFEVSCGVGIVNNPPGMSVVLMFAGSASMLSTELQLPRAKSKFHEQDNQLRSKPRKQTNNIPTMTADLTLKEQNDAIKKLKMKKSLGKDGICNEMIKHLGKAVRTLQSILKYSQLSFCLERGNDNSHSKKSKRTPNKKTATDQSAS